MKIGLQSFFITKIVLMIGFNFLVYPNYYHYLQCLNTKALKNSCLYFHHSAIFSLIRLQKKFFGSMLIILAYPSLINIWISALLAITVKVWCTAWRAFTVWITTVRMSVYASIFAVGIPVCCCVAGRIAIARTASWNDQYEKDYDYKPTDHVFTCSTIYV